MKKRLLILLLFPFLSYGQVQIGQDIDGEAANDQSGSSVTLSLDGSIIAIGAPWNDGNGNASGHVRVYENQGGNWIQIGQDINGNQSDLSGDPISLSLDGNTIGITKHEYISVYENQNNVWVQIGEDIYSGLRNSMSLSSDGSILAIGMGNSATNNGQQSGRVMVYENQNNIWIQVGQNIDGEAAYDNSGESISLSSDGNIIAIGASGNFNENGNFSGHVRVYENQGGTWIQIGQDIDGENTSDFSGRNISLSSDGTIIAIGATGNDGNGDRSGHVRLYENQNGVWVQIGQDIDGEAAIDFSGHVSLSSDGRIVVIGATGNDDNGNRSGHARIYKNLNNVWIQVGEDIDGEAANDESGSSVALSSDGTIVAIGAPYNDGNGNASGHVRVFDLSGPLSVEEVTQSQFSIYPNPASTTITIQLDQNSSLEKATIYNSLGQIVKTSTETIIDISDVSKGMYILEITTDQGKASRKLIIE